MRIVRNFNGEHPNFKLQFRLYFKLHETENSNRLFDQALRNKGVWKNAGKPPRIFSFSSYNNIAHWPGRLVEPVSFNKCDGEEDNLYFFSDQFPKSNINPLNAELNPICYLLALLAHHFLHVSRIRVKLLTFRLLMSYIYIYIYIYI